MISDPYAAGYTFARSAFTGGPTRDQKAVRTIYIYIYIYIYTDSEIIVLTRWGSLRLAPINPLTTIVQKSILPLRDRNRAYMLGFQRIRSNVFLINIKY